MLTFSNGREQAGITSKTKNTMYLKFYTLPLLLILLAVQLVAQPVLTTASQTPEIGETYEVQYAEVLDFVPGPGGANQTWDFTDQNLQYIQLQFSILAPEDGVSSADFPDADFVWLLDEFEAYNYYQETDTGLDLVGGASGTPDDILFKEIFTDTEDGLHFPATFQDSYTYYSAFTSFFFGTSSMNERNGEVEYDGYGTIILPDGTTYDNVLRMIIRSTTTAFPIMETQYAWILPGQFVPVMVYSFEDDDESVPTIYYSKKNIETSTRDLAEVDLGLRLQTNPVREKLVVNGDLQMLEGLEFSIVNTLGQSYAIQADDGGIDVSNLPSGMYYLMAASRDAYQVLPFMKQ